MHGIEQNRLNHQLRYAVQTRNLNQVSELIKAGADVNQKVYDSFPLERASESGSLEIAKFLIQHGANTNLAKSNGITAIYAAAVFGHFDVVKLLILNGAQVDTATNFNSRPIERPVEYGLLKVVELLLQYGANTRDNLFYTHNNLNMAKLLLAYGADINFTDEKGKTPLHEGIRVNHFEVAKLIVNHIAKLEVAGLYVSKENWELKNKLKNPFQEEDYNEDYNGDIASSYKENFDKCKKEVKKLEKENKPLRDFLKESNINKLANMWEQNENLRNKFDDPKSLKEQYPEYANMLINKANEVKKEIFLHNHLPLVDIFAKRYKCNFDDMNFTGIKTFLYAHNNDFKAELECTGTTLMNFVDFKDVRERHPPTLKVQAFAKALMKQIELNKQLFDIIKKGDSSRVSGLIRAGADVNAIIESKLYENDVDIDSHFGDVVPLHVAAIKGNEEIIQALIDNNAKVDAAMLFTQGGGERTALSCAVEAENLGIVKVLLINGANPNLKAIYCTIGTQDFSSRYECTPLHYATKMGNLAMVKLLIAYGADMNAQVEGNALGQKGIDAEYGYTPLLIAVKTGRLDIVNLLLTHGANINVKGGRDRCTPLELAVKQGKIAIAKLIINHIENPEASDRHVNSQLTSSKQPKIVDKKPIIPKVKDDKNTGGKNVVCGIDIDKEVEDKKPVKLAKEHNLLINDKNPEVFASKVQLTKFVDKASLPIAMVAAVLCISFVIANLNIELIIFTAVVALAAAITKLIVSYVQKDFLENNVVSKNLNNPNTEEYRTQQIV